MVCFRVRVANFVCFDEIKPIKIKFDKWHLTTILTIDHYYTFENTSMKTIGRQFQRLLRKSTNFLLSPRHLICDLYYVSTRTITYFEF